MARGILGSEEDSFMRLLLTGHESGFWEKVLRKECQGSKTCNFKAFWLGCSVIFFWFFFNLFKNLNKLRTSSTNDSSNLPDHIFHRKSLNNPNKRSKFILELFSHFNSESRRATSLTASLNVRSLESIFLSSHLHHQPCSTVLFNVLSFFSSYLYFAFSCFLHFVF